MPPGAFADLWQTIRAGRSWRGLVKNRCKNGDFYWVDAYVTPILRDGDIVEFQSVRTRPQPEARHRAEWLYPQWRQGRPPWRLRQAVLPWQVGQALLAALPGLLLATYAVWREEAGLAGLALAAGFLGALALHGHARPLRQLVAEARARAGHPLLTWLYTGRRDEWGSLRAALRGCGAEMRAIVSRLRNTCHYLQGVQDAQRRLHRAIQPGDPRPRARGGADCRCPAAHAGESAAGCWRHRTR